MGLSLTKVSKKVWGRWAFLLSVALLPKIYPWLKKIPFKKILAIGRSFSLLYVLLQTFADPQAWSTVLSLLKSYGGISLTEEQQNHVIQAGTLFCSFLLNFWRGIGS